MHVPCTLVKSFEWTGAGLGAASVSALLGRKLLRLEDQPIAPSMLVAYAEALTSPSRL